MTHFWDSRTRLFDFSSVAFHNHSNILDDIFSTQAKTQALLPPSQLEYTN
jgi:hypothetical protein